MVKPHPVRWTKTDGWDMVKPKPVRWKANYSCPLDKVLYEGDLTSWLDWKILLYEMLTGNVHRMKSDMWSWLQRWVFFANTTWTQLTDLIKHYQTSDVNKSGLSFTFYIDPHHLGLFVTYIVLFTQYISLSTLNIGLFTPDIGLLTLNINLYTPDIVLVTLVFT